MARKGRTCVVPECEQRAAIGAVVCNEHKETALGEQTDREIRVMTQRLTEMAKLEKLEDQRDAAQTFRRQIARGDYAALFSSEMVDGLNEEGRGYGLRQEIGMMRIAMLRLLLEEDDPSKMAHSLAKLSGALGKSMERQEGWEKTARHQKSHEAYLAASRNWVSPVEEKPAVIEAAVRAVEEGPNGEHASEWPRVGYPDYYEDVEEGESGRLGSGVEGV